MKNIKRTLKSLALGSVVCISITLPSYARPKDSGVVNISPIFTKNDGHWYPGRIQSNNFEMSNNGSRAIRVDKLIIDLTSCKNYKTDKVIDKGSSEFRKIAQNSTVTLKSGNKVLFEKTIASLLDESGALLNETIRIGAKSSVNLNMSISMNGEEIGNESQAIQSIFSVGVNYREESSGGDGSGESGSEDTEPEEPEEPENPGGSEDTDKPDKPENPGESEDTDKPDKPENPGGSEDTDKPDKPENPGGSEDTDKPDKPGGSGSTNKPGTGGNESNVGGSTNKLPQTGGFVNSSTLTILGLSVAGVGIALDRKSSSKKGGKIDE